MGMVITPTYICPVPKPFLARPVQSVYQENGSLPLVPGIRTTKVSLSTVPTISKASQHNNTIAIPTCSVLCFRKVHFQIL